MTLFDTLFIEFSMVNQGLGFLKFAAANFDIAAANFEFAAGFQLGQQYFFLN